MLTRRQVGDHNRSVEPLFTAVDEDNLKAASKLLNSGVPANVRELLDGGHMQGPTALHGVRSAEMAQLLVASGADIEARDSRGLTPLHNVVRYRDAATVQALIDAGADIHARETQNFGRTPLHLAAGDGLTDVGLVLLKAGADPMARVSSSADPHTFNQEGATCIDYAEAASDDTLVQAMHLAVANRQAKQLESAWSPSSADAEALMPPSTHSDHEAPTQQRSRRL